MTDHQKKAIGWLLMETAKAVLIIVVVVIVVSNLPGCSNEVIDITNPDVTEDDAGADGEGGADTEVVCTPDESPVVLEGAVSLDTNRIALSTCYDTCEAACRALVACDIVSAGSGEGRCGVACRTARGCDSITASSLCPNEDRSITVREMNRCLQDIPHMGCWCSDPETCWTTDDWLPESCSPEALCDSARDPC